jgi:hypothetical protein
MENIKPIRVKRIIENFDFSSNAIVKIIMSDDGDEPIYTGDIMGVPWWIVRDCWVDTCAEYEGISLYIENEKPVLEITCRETKEG